MKRILLKSVMFFAVVLSLKMIVFAQVKTDGDKEIKSCLGTQLSLKEGEPEADMGGKRYGRYIFTNISATPCTLSGYPKFALLNKTGKVLTSVKVSYDNDFPGGEDDSQTSVVTLEPGKTAWFMIFYNDGMALEQRKPIPVSAKVRVKAPNTTREFVLKSSIQACCGVEVSTIRGGLPE